MPDAKRDALTAAADRGAVVRTQEGRVTERELLIPAGAAQPSTVSRTPRKGQLISLTPMERRLVMGVGRMGMTIADGLVLSSTTANPVLTVAFIAYESYRAISDYRHGEVNTLGYQTSLSDVALRVGKEVGTAAIGVAIGHGVGTLIGLSAIPVAGQIFATTLLSVTLGICVGTLLTRYADRIFVRLQLQTQYGYSPNEQKSRKRFEQLLEAQHDLSSFETCRIVQHYRDYRVACGWESHTDVDDYRASADITMMPVSFQHFGIVQLQRKWGFLNERGECKKVYKALLLLHHPDKGGSSDLAAQLNHDFEVYAFCQGWQEDCPAIYQTGSTTGRGTTDSEFKKRKKSPIVDFLRSLFRPASNSTVEAEGLRQHGLLALEAGTPSELHRLDELNWEFNEEEDIKDGNPVFGTSATVKQRSVSRVLASIQRSYQLATEATTFAGLVHLYKQPERWAQLEQDVFVFNCLQAYVKIVDEKPEGDIFFASREHLCRSFRWSTKEEALALREERREAIVSLCFPPTVSVTLMEALELWRTAKSLAESFFKQCAGGDGDDAEAISAVEGTGQTLDTLLNIQKALQKMTDRSTEQWKDTGASDEECVEPSFVEEVKGLGLTASCALAGAHALSMHEKLWKMCEDYFKGRRRKLETLTSLLNEIDEIRSQLNTLPVKECEALQARHDDYIKQIFLVHHVFGEVDAITSELYDVYTMHLSEKSGILKKLPSSCGLCVHEKLEMPRFVKYERERTLMNYMNLEVEPRNAMDPASSPVGYEMSVECLGEVTAVEFALLRAQYSDPLTGTVTPCWLKCYTFSKNEGEEAPNRAAELFSHIMEREIRVPELCASHRVTCVTDVFCDEYTRRIFFHVPRGGTQLRFSSTHDVNRRIMRLGVRWLHDALQSIIELHSCQLVHGAISLSSFTYDDFGNTTLGFFSSAARDHVRDTSTPLDDVINFAASLHAEVLPYLQGAALPVTPVRPLPTMSKVDERFSAPEQKKQLQQQQQQEVLHVFREVADRLIGKVEPQWSLLDARTFVRRFLEFSYDSDERNYLFTKEVSYPAFWATQKSIIPVSLVADRRVNLELPPGAGVLLNRNLHLWEIYWKCRRKMVQKRGGGFFSTPAGFKKRVPFLPCSDDCEVNERFLWRTCGDEEEAWQICLEGTLDTALRLRLWPPWAQTGGREERRAGDNAAAIWGVVFRVSLGTVVEGDGGYRREKGGPSRRRISSLQKDLERAAEQHSVLLSGCGGAASENWEVEVPSPTARCYPEYMVCAPA